MCFLPSYNDFYLASAWATAFPRVCVCAPFVYLGTHYILLCKSWHYYEIQLVVISTLICHLLLFICLAVYSLTIIIIVFMYVPLSSDPLSSSISGWSENYEYLNHFYQTIIRLYSVHLTEHLDWKVNSSAWARTVSQSIIYFLFFILVSSIEHFATVGDRRSPHRHSCPRR